MKSWVRLSIILVIALAAIGVGLGATIRSRAFIYPMVTENCHVYFLNGPNKGDTEPVSFLIKTGGSTGGWLNAGSSMYVGGTSTSGTWSYTDTKKQTVHFTFAAQLAAIPGATLTVTTTIPVSQNKVVGTSQGTVTDSSGHVLSMADTTTTCPAFAPLPYA